jgi:hypothetical protein
MTHLAARDAAAAAAAVEKLPARPERDADLAALKGAQALFAEAPVLLSRLIKGRAFTVDYWDVEGGEARIEGNVERLDALRIEIRKGDLSVTLPYGEIRTRTLAQAWLARPGAKPEDRAAAALACAAEGDLEGAKSLGGDTARFERLAAEAPPAAESEARRIFWEAERAWFDFSRTQEAVDAYKALLADHGTTAFVRRNRAAIAARTEAPKEFYFEPADMATTAGFIQGRSKKVETCWTSERDLEGAQRRSNFVEIAFPAAAGTAYRCWFYVGGCCQEVLTFFAQGTEFTGFAEPGGEFDVPVRHSIGSLKKRHQDHLGPKAPERWDWVSIPLPKFGAAGTKRVRLLSDQKGFSVGYAVVSATRSGSPSERDLATMEKLRSETPGFASGPAAGVGSILREWWTGIGGGDLRSLTTHRDFPNKPVGSAPGSAAMCTLLQRATTSSGSAPTTAANSGSQPTTPRSARSWSPRSPSGPLRASGKRLPIRSPRPSASRRGGATTSRRFTRRAAAETTSWSAGSSPTARRSGPSRGSGSRPQPRPGSSFRIFFRFPYPGFPE